MPTGAATVAMLLDAAYITFLAPGLPQRHFSTKSLHTSNPVLELLHKFYNAFPQMTWAQYQHMSVLHRAYDSVPMGLAGNGVAGQAIPHFGQPRFAVAAFQG